MCIWIKKYAPLFSVEGEPFSSKFSNLNITKIRRKVKGITYIYMRARGGGPDTRNGTGKNGPIRSRFLEENSVFGRKILVAEGDVFHSEFLSLQVVQNAGVGGEVEAQLVGVQGLAGLVVLAVHIAVAVLSIA